MNKWEYQICNRNYLQVLKIEKHIHSHKMQLDYPSSFEDKLITCILLEQRLMLFT